MKPNIRWMLRADMREVLEIEELSFRCPWAEDDFIAALRQRNTIGMVVEDLVFGGEADKWEVLGYVLYALEPGMIEIKNLAVHPECRRCGLGSMLMERLKSKLSPSRRCKLVTQVSEYNDDALLFFRSCGFLATQVLHEHYGSYHEYPSATAYELTYRVMEDATP